MSLSISPIKQEAYTKNGNVYTKSNVGKYAAVAVVGTEAAIIGTKAALKKIKSVKLPKFETLKNSFNNVKTSITEFAGKIKKPEIGKLWNNSVNFVNTNLKAAKISGAIKQFGTKVLDYIEKHPIRIGNAVKFAGVAIGALATGLAIDFIVNKINAKRTDELAAKAEKA